MTAHAPITHRATAADRAVRRYDEEAPEYRVTECGPAGTYQDVVELPDGTHAYLLDFGGYWALYRSRVAYRYGSGEELNSRTAPESCEGLIGDAPVRASELDQVRSCGADLVGFADLISPEAEIAQEPALQLLLDQLKAAGLSLWPASAVPFMPERHKLTVPQLRRAVGIAGSFHVALAELRGGAS